MICKELPHLVLLTVCIVMLLSPSSGTNQKRDTSLCRKAAMNLIVYPPPRIADRCSKTIVPTIGCRGHCNSYSKVDHTYPFDITRSCSCCTPTSFAIHVVLMHCKDGQRYRRPFRYAQNCVCRPCDHHVTYYESLEKREAEMANPLDDISKEGQLDRLVSFGADV